jgi:hypothetical protein
LELNYTAVSYYAHTANGTPVSSSRKRARGDSSSNANSSNGTAGASRDDPDVSDDEVQALAVEAANRAQVRFFLFHLLALHISSLECSAINMSSFLSMA